MIFDFKFWHYFARQGELIHNLHETTMQKFNRRLAWIFAFGLLLFAVREIWGMNTASLTAYLAGGMWEDYTIARWTSLVGTLIWAGLYMAFHTFGVAYLFRLLTKMGWRPALVMQTYVISLLLIEKALLFMIFAVAGYTLPVSLFSFGPLAATFLDIPYLTFFFNQLTVFTALIIAFQYRFVRAFTEISPKKILFVLILVHVLVALAIASLTFVPLSEMLADFTRGGASVE